MGILYFEKEKVFKLDTPKSTYMLGIIGEEGFIAHIYYGKRIKSHRLTYLIGMGEPAMVPDENAFDRVMTVALWETGLLIRKNYQKDFLF